MKELNLIMPESVLSGMRVKKQLLLTVVTAAMIFAAAGCGTASAPAPEKTTEAVAAGTRAEVDLSSLDPSPDWVGKLDAAKDADQLFVVAGVGQTTAYVSMHEKDENGSWKEILTTPGYIGKHGLGKTKEGDGMTPVGEYHFNYAFGIADDPGCVFPYQKVTDDDYWSGDQREGYHYNEMVSIKDLPDLNTEDSEHIVDYTYHYQYCMNISWNEDGTPGKGSAIFLHCLGPNKPYTGGCVAIPQDKVITAMQNVKKDCVVVIDTLSNIAPDYYEDWDLGPAEEDKTTEAAGKPQADENWYQAVLDEQADKGDYQYYALRDINLDGAYELFLSTTEDYFIGDEQKACLMAYGNGQPEVLQEIGGAAGEYWLVNQSDATLSYYYRASGEGHLVLNKLEDGKLVQVSKADYYGPHHYTEEDNEEEVFFIDGDDVSKEDFDSYFEQYGNEAGAVTYELISEK